LRSAAYGAELDEMLDIYPAPDAKAPVVVFVHGGQWQFLGRGDVGLFAPLFNAAGIAFVAPDFGAFPKTDFEQMIQRLRAALRWVAHNAASFGADPAKLFVAGHSSGAHLAAMTLSEGWQEAAGAPADLVKGALLVSGLYDLEPVCLSFRNEVLKLNVEAARRYSPINVVPTRPTAPILLGYGMDESAEFIRQSEAFGQAWREAGGRCQMVPVPASHHFSAVNALKDRGTALASAALALISGRP
jgi:arylformamidase